MTRINFIQFCHDDIKVNHRTSLGHILFFSQSSQVLPALNAGIHGVEVGKIATRGKFDTCEVTAKEHPLPSWAAGPPHGIL